MKTFASAILLGTLVLTSTASADSCKTKTACQTNKQQNIVDTAVAAGSFKTLAAALGAADLVGALQSKGPFTVFAPTDAAFAKLPKGTVEDLLKPENKEKLQAILKFHVVKGQIGLSDALAAKTARTLQGEQIRIGFSDGQVKVNGAALISADVKATNGVIHVIDAVLLPSSDSKQKASMSPRQEIELALDKGVPAFNNGDPDKCAEIYMNCLVSLAKSTQIDCSMRKTLNELVDRTNEVECGTKRSWMLRSGLDHAYTAMNR